jgi:ABC-type multidrug transport system fused ATPase/permease subunit
MHPQGRRTVRENLLYGVDKPGSITDEQIFAALKQAAMHDTLMLKKSTDGRRIFPLGIMTVIKDKGGKPFSVGQAQRLAIARALLSRPRLLLLDEAMSALDELNQAKVQQAVDQLVVNDGVTIISIAHR